MTFIRYLGAAALTVVLAAGVAEGQHCLGVASGPVTSGAARATAWTGEHRYSRRSGVAVAGAWKRLVGSVSFAGIHDKEFDASIHDVGLALVADIPDAEGGLWICPAVGYNRVLGPRQFTHPDESRSATELSAGLGFALPVDAGPVTLVPSLWGRYVNVNELWTFELSDRRRRGSRIEIGVGAQTLFRQGGVVSLLLEMPYANPGDRTFPFWRRRNEIAWTLLLSQEIRFARKKN